jgi:3-dehydroquinate synthase
VTEGSGRRVVRVAVSGKDYEVVVAPGVLSDLGRRLCALGNMGPVVLVTNPTVRALYGAEAEASLRAAGIDAVIAEIPDGERYKTMATLETILDAALSRGADRSSIVVALGGGVVGDLAGFAAATLFRGVRLYMVPTTLLAQVDSSVGGKTGINRPQGKNLVGAFHQPSGVLADTAVLATLPAREYRAGLAEVVKYGVILDGEFFDFLERSVARLNARAPELLGEVVERSVRLKAYVVERDEREQGLRRLLNFGHTVGHAVEKVTGYSRLLHGEAVAMGMVAAARLSENLGLCGPDVGVRVQALLSSLGLSTAIPADVDRAAVIDAVAYDKKASGGKVICVLAEAIGRCVQCEIDRQSIRGVL